MKALDGNLFTWIRHIRLLRFLTLSQVLHHTDSLRRAISDMRRLVDAARSEGCSWIYAESDLTLNKEDGRDYPWQLPSADLAELLFDDSDEKYATNNDVERFFKAKKLKITGMSWDTESGAVYPAFKDKMDGLAFIAALNQLMDERWASLKATTLKEGLV